MTIYIGADHGGFDLKEHLKAMLEDEEYKVVDVGAAHMRAGDDYPEFASAVADK